MSTLKVDNIRHNSATSDAITTAADGTCTANITNNLSVPIITSSEITANLINTSEFISYNISSTNLTSSQFNSDDIEISFNSRYLIDIASQIESDSILINLKDAGSPVLINDNIDKNSFHVVMPMKI